MTNLPCDKAKTRSPDDVDAIAAVLRGTPFHRWPQLRALGAETRYEAFDAATAQVRARWTKNEQHAEVREALTLVATEIILALPDWAGGEHVLIEHLDSACAALHAARELSASLDARSVA